MKPKILCLSAIIFLLSSFNFNEKNKFDPKRRVLIIGIDGVRSDMIQQDIAPNLYQFSQLSDTYFNPEHKTEKITWSATNWGSICTGVHVDKHNARNNFFKGAQFDEFPHFFSYINEVDEQNEMELVSVVHWNPINAKITTNHADYATPSPISDTAVRDMALNLLNENHPKSPDVLFIHFDDVDHAGHKSGFSTGNINYVSEMQQVDSYIADLLETVANRKEKTDEDWLIIIVSDHGGSGEKHKQSNHPEIGNTIFFINHRDINSKYTLSGSRMVDVAPTILKYLNVFTDKAESVMDGIPLAF